MLLCTAVYMVMAVGYLILNREQLFGLLAG